MSWQPGKWYRIGNRSKLHIVHRHDETITWCGYPTDWEPYELHNQSRIKKCTDCRNKEETFVTERAQMAATRLRAGKAGW